MSLSLRFVRLVVLAGWVGAIVYFAAVVTEGSFQVLPSREEAGRLVGWTLSGLHTMGLVAAAIFIIASVALSKLKALVAPTVLGVVLMVLLTVASEYYVVPRMAELHSQMGSVELTPASDPRRAEFDRLHGVSVDVEAAVLVSGLIAVFLTVREDSLRR
jgi:hypothetical protein